MAERVKNGNDVDEINFTIAGSANGAVHVCENPQVGQVIAYMLTSSTSDRLDPLANLSCLACNLRSV